MSPIPAMYRGFAPHPDDDKDPYVFRTDLSELGMGTGRVIFSRDLAGTTTRIHLDLAPLSLQKQSATKNPRYWVTGTLDALAVAATAAAIRWRSRPPKGA